MYHRAGERERKKPATRKKGRKEEETQTKTGERKIIQATKKTGNTNAHRKRADKTTHPEHGIRDAAPVRTKKKKQTKKNTPPCFPAV